MKRFSDKKYFLAITVFMFYANFAKIYSLPIKGVNGVEVEVSGICKADKNGLYIEKEADEGVTILPWGYLDFDFLKDKYPNIHQSYFKALNGSETSFFMGTCRSSTLAKKKLKYKKSIGFDVLENAVLISAPANDGDSFYVKHKGKEYVFRLYYVDCPETSNSHPDRVAKQAKEHGITTKQVLEVGHEATKFTNKLLKNKPFTVFTKWEDAMGQSALGRSYAFIYCKDGMFLSEALTENGYVRIFGNKVVTPEGRTISSWESYLRKLEKKAKQKKMGAWKY